MGLENEMMLYYEWTKLPWKRMTYNAPEYFVYVNFSLITQVM